MNEVIAAPVQKLASDAGFELSFGPGELLKHAREACGLDVATLAVALKVSVQKLEALEADRFDLMPDAMYVRAFASRVCRHLNIDSEKVLLLLPPGVMPHLDDYKPGLNVPFRSAGMITSQSLWSNLPRPVVVAGAVLLLGTAGLIFLPPASGPTTQATLSPPNPASTGSLSGLLPISDGLLTVVPDLPSVSSETLAKTASKVVLTEPDEVSALVVGGSVVTVAASVPATLGMVVFTAKGESWVEVTDATHAVVLRRMLAAGEVAGASGALPLSAVVGRADNTLVQVHGKTFDVRAIARDNVARFEVK